MKQSYDYKDSIKISLKRLDQACSMDELDKLYKEFRSLYKSEFLQKQAKESELHNAYSKAFSIYKKKRARFDPTFIDYYPNNKFGRINFYTIPTMLVLISIGFADPFLGLSLLIMFILYILCW